MKRLLSTILLGVSAIVLVAAADAAVITNTCTSAYTAINFPGIWVASGWDTVAIMTDTQPNIVVAKYARNLRTGVENGGTVTAISGDTIEFRIAWSNQGGANADTVTLTDYIPSGLTYVPGSLTNAETNCSSGNAAESGGAVIYIINGAAGTSPGPYGYGEMKFRAAVN